MQRVQRMPEFLNGAADVGRVAVAEVARAAEVSEQTVYNYFQTKKQLVTDRDQQIQDELCRRIRARAPGTTPAAAIRDFVLDTVEGIRRIPAEQWRGELGFLAAISPTVHRLSPRANHRGVSHPRNTSPAQRYHAP